MTDKEQVIINGEKYNKCNGCKLWDGYICTGDRSYEPNAETHRAICNKHMAEEFWKVYHELFHKTQECEELKTENEELNNRMAEVIYRATGGRLSYSNYTLDAIEKAFNDQLEILSDQKVENKTKELKQKLYLAQNEVHSKTEYIQEQRDIIKKLEQECEKYEQAFDEIKEIIKNNFRDNYKVGGVLTLIASYLTENGEFVDERGDFLKAFEDLLDKEHSSDNKTLSISRQILDIINKAKRRLNEE